MAQNEEINQKEVYIQSKGKVVFNKKNPVLLKDLVTIYTDSPHKKEIEKINYPMANAEYGSSHCISMISIIHIIKDKFPDHRVIVIGSPDILVGFNNQKSDNDRYKLLRVALVSFLLFIGSITAIINFHSDVNMKTAQRTIYRIVTGSETDNLLLLQIPYSLGIGVGMSVFFNHIFKRRINDEPSPLEVEMYLYQQNMDEYVKNNSDKGS